jgi:hypothetical protein
MCEDRGGEVGAKGPSIPEVRQEPEVGQEEYMYGCSVGGRRAREDGGGKVEGKKSSTRGALGEKDGSRGGSALLPSTGNNRSVPDALSVAESSPMNTTFEARFTTFKNTTVFRICMGFHCSEPIGKLCRSAFSLILARSFWTGRDVSSAEVYRLHESLARLPSPFEMPVVRKQEPYDADKALTTSLIHLLWASRKSAVTRSMRSEGPCELAEVFGTFGWDS